MGYAYTESPAICHDRNEAAPDDPVRYRPSTVPGARLPNVVLDDGTPLHDRLGPWFTLLAVGTPPSRALVDEAARRGIPLAVVTLTAEWLVPIFGRQQLLIRPDQHIGWRGQTLEACQAEQVLQTLLPTEDALVPA